MKVRYSAIAAMLLGATVAWAQSGGGGGGTGGSGGSGSSAGSGGNGASGSASGNSGNSTQSNQSNSSQNDRSSNSDASQSSGGQNQSGQNDASQNRSLRSETVQQGSNDQSAVSRSQADEESRSAADRGDTARSRSGSESRFRNRDLIDERRRELRSAGGGRTARNRDRQGNEDEYRDRNSRDPDDSDRQASNDDQSSERNRRAYSSDRDSNDNRERNRRIGISFSDSDNALVISRLNERGAGARAGLRRGDEIVSLNGRRINSPAQFMRWATEWVGTRVPLIVWRDGERRTLSWNGDSDGYDNVQASWNDTDESSNSSHGRGGFAGVILDTDYDYAAVVRQVYRDSPAERAGVRAGDTILAINGHAVSSADDVSETLSELDPGTPVELQVSHASPRRIELRLSSRGQQNVASRDRDDDRSDQEERSDEDRD